jgi:molecular chaperone DnaJ
VVPKKLNREQKKVFEQLLQTLPSPGGPQEKSLLDKVKDYFV